MDPPVVSGVEDKKIARNINIYPNPSSGIFNIRFSDSWKGDVGIKVVDIFGRSKYQNIIDNSSGSMSHRVDISSSSQGLYILELSQGDKKVIKKIIKR